ncbi:hypothetical protein Tco_0635285 [Tanacetum coccineum]
MSQPANDEFSQHLSDDDASNIRKHQTLNGNSKKRISIGEDGVIRILSPVTAAEIQAVEKERKAKNILLMANSPGETYEKIFMKAVFKQQFEAFTISSSEGLEKGYDRFQQLLSQLEAHGAEVSTEGCKFTKKARRREESDGFVTMDNWYYCHIRENILKMRDNSSLMGISCSDSEKMAREAEFKKQRVFNTGNGVAKPVWNNANRALSSGYNWRNSNPNSNYDRSSIEEHGSSGHMTGNKDQLEDFEEFNGGSVTFGGSTGYISGKGRIRVSNLDFDSVSFVKELGHFNLFSISQICDKQHKVLFTETECLVYALLTLDADEN